jgi:hypothetical protein
LKFENGNQTSQNSDMNTVKRTFLTGAPTLAAAATLFTGCGMKQSLKTANEGAHGCVVRDSSNPK